MEYKPKWKGIKWFAWLKVKYTRFFRLYFSQTAKKNNRGGATLLVASKRACTRENPFAFFIFIKHTSSKRNFPAFPAATFGTLPFPLHQSRPVPSLAIRMQRWTVSVISEMNLRISISFAIACPADASYPEAPDGREERQR